MPDNKKQGRSNKTMTFFVCFLAALAGLLFGLDIGVIAGALPFIANEFQISAHTQEWVVSSMMFRGCRRCGRQRLALLQTGP